MREGWTNARIADVVNVVNGGTPKTKVPEFWGGPHLWITPAEMGNRITPYLAESRRTLTDSGLQRSSASLVPPNSVILSTRAPIGHLVINTEPMAFNQGCRGLVPGENLNGKYLYYFLSANTTLLNDLGSGTTFKELAAGKLKNVQLPVPPLEEQKRIVAILDEAFAGIETAIANTEKNLANARELFKSYARWAFSEYGKSWLWRQLSEVCENLDRRRVPITKTKRKSGDVPYYGASGIVDHVADYLFDEDLLLVSEDGANLLARTYPIAFSISGKSWVNNHAHVLKFKEITSQKFIEYYLNSISLATYVSGMAQPKLNQKSLNSIPVPWPSLEVQEEVLTRIDDLRQSRDKLGDTYQKKLVSLVELKQSLLQKAFSGELTADRVEEEFESATA